MSLGFERAGFTCKVSVDSWKEAVENYNHNRKRKVAVVMDVKDFINSIKPDGKMHATVLVGGPPCQGYSLAGKRNVMDPRNSMVDEYLRAIDIIRPLCFVMENVVGIRSMERPEGKTKVIRWIEKEVRRIGYKVKWKLLYAHWYGIPQARPRIFFLGWKDGVHPPAFPPITHLKYTAISLFGKVKPSYVTVGDALSSIPKDAPNQDLVYEFKDEKYIEKVKNLRMGESVYENFTESHRRLDTNKPAFTIKENHGSIAIHPKETRMINLREMATLQGFPFDFEFVGDKRSIAKMIGNSVPAGMAEVIAMQVKKAIKRTLIEKASGIERGSRGEALN